MPNSYVPDAGDIVWLEFSPQVGREQMGHRPALVLSPASYNSKTNLMLCCPLSTKIKGYPFEVLIGEDQSSVALADQIKSLDWKVRNAKLKSKATEMELSAVRLKAIILIGKP
ncbi:MAG: endoribonuclease MazF [Acinetobacter sp.]|jgi:mRNA interferase MazF|nr:endoribonuclease MazF [Acinetobacter sp.]MBP7612227.1 endoribonuclease MazF [Paludibacter sp.]